MRMQKEQFETIRKWMYRNARPLDLARWRFHFENGGREEVLAALAAYQNPDGGFGHALEADSWNAESAPIQTWCATEILFELGVMEKDNEIVKGILSYLESGKDFHEGYWYAEIPSNDEHPHAQWWSYSGDVVAGWGYNPTICLVGFILYFAEKESGLYNTACDIARKAIDSLLHGGRVEGMHELENYSRFHEYCTNAGITELYDREAFVACLKQKVKVCIGDSNEHWKDTYMCKPSRFISSPESVYYIDNKTLADYETDYIVETMNTDGTWDITWNWSGYPEQWAISKNWWKADLILRNMSYLNGFGCL